MQRVIDRAAERLPEDGRGRGGKTDHDPGGLGFDVLASDARELERRRVKLAAHREARRGIDRANGMVTTEPT